MSLRRGVPSFLGDNYGGGRLDVASGFSWSYRCAINALQYALELDERSFVAPRQSARFETMAMCFKT